MLLKRVVTGVSCRAYWGVDSLITGLIWGVSDQQTPSWLKHAPAGRSGSDTVPSFPPGMKGALVVLRLQPAGGESGVGGVDSSGRIESVEEECPPVTTIRSLNWQHLCNYAAVYLYKRGRKDIYGCVKY